MGSGHDYWQLWDATSGALHRVGATHNGTGACICEVDGLEMLLQAGCPVVAPMPGSGFFSVGFAPCGEKFATGSRDGEVVVWDAQTGEAEHRVQGSGSMDAETGNAAMCLTFSAGGARLACVNGTGSIDVWDMMSSALLLTIPAPHGFDPDPHTHCASVSFSPTDNRRLISAGVGRRTHLWDVDSGEKIRSIEGRQFAVFSPDGRSIATARAKRRRDVDLVDAESGALLLRMVGHEKRVICASFSDDGSKLATGSNDDTCTLGRRREQAGFGQRRRHLQGGRCGGVEVWDSRHTTRG